MPAAVQSGGSSRLTVTVTPGAVPAAPSVAVTADLSPIGGPGLQTFYDDGVTGGDITANDRIFSWTASIPGGPGFRTITATVTETLSATLSRTASVGDPRRRRADHHAADCLDPGIGGDVDVRRTVRDDRRRRDGAPIERLLHPDARRNGRWGSVDVRRALRLHGIWRATCASRWRFRARQRNGRRVRARVDRVRPADHGNLGRSGGRRVVGGSHVACADPADARRHARRRGHGTARTVRGHARAREPHGRRADRRHQVRVLRHVGLEWRLHGGRPRRHPSGARAGNRSGAERARRDAFVGAEVRRQFRAPARRQRRPRRRAAGSSRRTGHPRHDWRARSRRDDLHVPAGSAPLDAGRQRVCRAGAGAGRERVHGRVVQHGTAVRRRQRRRRRRDDDA